MTPSFHRFPHTPHLVWLGEGSTRVDKALTDEEAAAFIAREVVVEEKIDGANLGLSTDEDCNLRAQNRGSWLSKDNAPPQFHSLWSWLAPRREGLLEALWPNLVLFGEWCVAVHSVKYDALPDWFLGFDVFDRAAGRYWSTVRRDKLLRQLRLHGVPLLTRGHFKVAELMAQMAISRVGADPMEGVYVRAESEQWLRSRAKLVRAEFVQAINSHWSRGPMRRNRLDPSAWSDC